jgi:hypothetical protein
MPVWSLSLVVRRLRPLRLRCSQVTLDVSAASLAPSPPVLPTHQPLVKYHLPELLRGLTGAKAPAGNGALPKNKQGVLE